MSAPARFAAVYAALTAAHELGDYWVQTDHQAVTKGIPNAAGRGACTRHVATYTATQALALAGVARVTGMRLSPRRAALALAFSAVTHYAADRQGNRWAAEKPRGVARLAHSTGSGEWIKRDPTGAPQLLDQSFHKGCIAVAALIACGGSAP